MNWLSAGYCAIQSEGDSYFISRSPQDGYVTDGRVCFTLSHAGAVVESRWCDDNPVAREATRDALKEIACARSE